MIYYEPNKNWFRDIGHLTTSWTMRRIFNGIVMIGVAATVICCALFFLGIKPTLSWSVFSLLGIVLSILLVFRTNTAYDRWWEGRNQWGTLVNNTRGLAMILHSALPPEDVENRKYFARHIANFCIALRDHLRGTTRSEDLIGLTEAEQRLLAKTQHVPNQFALWIYFRVQQIFKEGAFTEADVINIKPHHQVMVDVLGACERIRKTPIPFSYSVYIKVYITTYGLMLPFGLYSDFGFYTIPLTMFIFFAMIGVELMAQEIEEPFGLDCNDLPTGDIAMTIKKNVFEILENEIPKQATPTQLYSKIF
jgi:ion channel-forming bestrophin family protein